MRTGQRRAGEDGRTFLLEEELTGEDSVRLLVAWTRSHSLVIDKSYAGCRSMLMRNPLCYMQQLDNNVLGLG